MNTFLIFILSLILYCANSQPTTAPQSCCSGSQVPNGNGGFSGQVLQTYCNASVYQCSSWTSSGNGSQYSCGCIAGATCCTGNNCNCPGSVHKTGYQIGLQAANMRNIMFPVLGMIFGLVWVLIAFLGPFFPHTIMVLVISICNAIFGVFLLFNPTTVYVGLYFIGLGAFGIAVVRHHHSHYPFATLAIFSFLGCLFISGLVILVQSAPMIEQLVGTVLVGNPTQCEQSMDLYNYANNYFGVNLRCENYLLWLVFVLFFILVLQPILILCAYALVHTDNINNNQVVVTKVPA